jgi:hypothetical protein
MFIYLPKPFRNTGNHLEVMTLQFVEHVPKPYTHGLSFVQFITLLFLHKIVCTKIIWICVGGTCSGRDPDTADRMEGLEGLRGHLRDLVIRLLDGDLICMLDTKVTQYKGNKGNKVT